LAGRKSARPFTTRSATGSPPTSRWFSIAIFAPIDCKTVKKPVRVGGEPVADLVVKGRADLRPAKIDENIVPQLIDEIPVLAVVATQARGTSILRGIEELRVKETDRIAAIAANLRALGANVQEEKAGLIIEGPTPLKGALVNARGDHRIAMSMAVASLIAHHETTIEGSESVAISFPNFWDLLGRLAG
jgi:3-phosphoshikimate 1-carboxyvinyltransferase